jgi:hypothetical protein
MTQGNEPTDPDKNLSGWIKNNTLTSYDNGTCNYHLNIGKDGSNRKGTYNYSPNTGQALGYYMDYYVCGAGTDTNPSCRALTKAEWGGIFSNCKDKNSDSKASGTKYDYCTNMVDDNDGFRQSNFNSDADDAAYNRNGTWDPSTCKWSEQICCGEDEDEGYTECSRSVTEGNFGASGMYPAFPTNIKNMYSIIDQGDDDNFTGEQINDGNWLKCPHEFWSEGRYPKDMIGYSCIADGDEDGMRSPAEGLPACGASSEDRSYGGHEIARLRTLNGERDAAIRFCKRAERDYLASNLMDCCITDKTFIFDQDGKKNECPTDYCLTKVEFTDADTAAASSCTIPIVEGDQQFCYQLSDTCNQVFKDECTVDIFLNKPPVGETPERKKYDQCRHWASIMPSEFNELAEELCHPKPWLDIIKTSSSRVLSLDDIMEAGAGGGSSKVTNLVDVFKNPICRTWLLDNFHTAYQNTNETVLDTIKETCATVVKEDGTDENGEKKWLKRSHYDDFDFCPCYLPDEYYDYWKQENLFSDDGVVTNIHKNYHLQPMCYKGDCIQSLFYNTTSLDSCPRAIEVCYNQISSNIAYADDNTRIVAPPMESIQVCNFSSTSGTDDGSTVTVDGQTVDDETINDYLGAVDDLVGSEISDINHLLLPSSFSREDSNTFISDNLPFIGIIFVVSIVMVVILLLIGGKKGNSIMPMPMPMPMQMPMSVN